MFNNDWEQIGNEIRRTIQDAVDSRDFNRLNQTVSDTIGQAMENVSRGLKNGGWYGENPMKQSGFPGGGGPVPESDINNQSRKQNAEFQKRNTGSQMPNGSVAADGTRYLKGTSVKIGGIFLAVTGYVFGVCTLIFLGLLGVGAAMTGWEPLLGIAAGLFVLFFIIFMFMGVKGTSMASSVGRFTKYKKIIAGRDYCNVSELSQKAGRPVKAVVKDIRKMIRKGWFRQGHLDDQETCLMVSEEAFRQYTGLMERMKQAKAEKEAAEEKQKQEYDKLSPEVQKVVKAGDEFVQRIRQANDAIPGEEISAKISRMEMLVDRIFDRVEQNPDTVDDIRKLMDYYLPTTVKLLEAYEDLDRQPVQGENIRSAKVEIEKTMDTLNTAFEKLLDDLFQDTAWDLSSDISVLHTMLAQEGLTEDGLGKTGK